MKKFNEVFFIVFFIGLLSFSYARRDAEIVISSGSYISQTGNGYNTDDRRDYAIDVIIPGDYDFVFNATNNWDTPSNNASNIEKALVKSRNVARAGNAKFDVLLDDVTLIRDVVVSSQDGLMGVFSKQAYLPVGKHKLTIVSKSNDWWMTRFSLTLLSTRQIPGYLNIPGSFTATSFSESSGGLKTEIDSIYMNPGNYADYNIYVDKCGVYTITFDGVFAGEESGYDSFNKDNGDIIRVLVDNKEMGTIKNLAQNVTSFSGQIDLPEGNHKLELYNNGGHFTLSRINVSLDREKYMKGTVEISREELYRKPTDFDVQYNTDEEGMSIDDAKDNIDGFLDKLVQFFADIFAKLLMPIMNLFLKILEKFLIDEDGIIRTLTEMVIDIYTLFIRMWLFELWLVLLKVIDALVIVFNIFAGTKDIVINGQSKILFNYIFESPGVQRVFWGIFLVGVALNITIAIITIAKASATDDKEKSVGATIKEIAKSALMYIMVPIFVIFSVNLASVVLKKTDDIISVSTSEARLTFGNTLFMALSMGEETPDYKDCSNNPSFTDRARVGFYNDNQKYKISSNSGKIFNFSFSKLIVSIAISAFIIIMLLLSIIMFVTRMFDLILLFVVSPYFAATIPLDGGGKFKKWRMTFIAKLVSGFGLVIMMKIFVSIILPIILGGQIIISSSWIIDIGLKLIFLAGGMYAVFKSHNLLMQIINPQLAMAEMGIAEVGVQATKEVSNLVISEAKSQATGGTSGGSAGGLSDQQKTLAAMK